MKLYNVEIGDKFKNGKHLIAEVVDFHKVCSYTNNDIVRWECIAKGINTLATNTFIVQFSTVVRNKITT